MPQWAKKNCQTYSQMHSTGVEMNFSFFTSAFSVLFFFLECSLRWKSKTFTYYTLFTFVLLLEVCGATKWVNTIPFFKKKILLYISLLSKLFSQDVYRNEEMKIQDLHRTYFSQITPFIMNDLSIYTNFSSGMQIFIWFFQRWH